jgi:hypothetical protein
VDPTAVREVSTANLQDRFGASLSFGGSRLIAGAPLEETANGTRLDTGAIYVFE